MTKLIRIENADTSDYKVRVSVFDRNTAEDGAPGYLAEVHTLALPCQMKDIYIHTGRYVVIEEYKHEQEIPS